MKQFLIISLVFFSKVQGFCHDGIITTEHLTNTTTTASSTLSTTPEIPTTTESTSTSTVSSTSTTTEAVTSTTTFPTSTTELTTTTTSTTTEIPTTTTEKNLCPHGFYDKCKQTCDCLDLSADTERLNKIYNKFSVEYPGIYVNATLVWSECFRVNLVSCSEGKPVVFLFNTNTTSLKFDTNPNINSAFMSYKCEGTNWVSRQTGDVGYEAYYSCQL